MNKEFRFEFYNVSKNLEWLAYIGQPILYDGELYVTRRLIEPGTKEYLIWVTGMRVV